MQKRLKAILISFVLAIGFIPFINSPAYAAIGCAGGTEEFTWDGSASTAWETAANWDENSVPGAGDNVCIPDATTTPNDPVITTAALADNFEVASGGIISMTAGSLTVAAQFFMSGTWSNTGTSTLTANSDATIGVTPAVATFNGGDLDFNGNFAVNNGGEVHWLNGNFDVGAGTIFNSGGFEVGGNDTLTASLFTNDAGMEKTGSGTAILNTNHTITAGHGLTVTAGTLTISNGKTLVQNGTVNIADGTFNLGSGTYTAGSTSTLNMTHANANLTAATIALATATANAKGTLNGNVTLGAGTLNVADGSDSYGILNVTGSFTQTAGIVRVEVNGSATPGTDHDKLVVTGVATLAGTLNIEASSFTPSHDQSINPISYGSHTGTYTITDDLGQWAWLPTYGSTFLTVHADGNPGSIAGTVYWDENGDGVKQGGETTGVSGATVYWDMNDDGMLDEDDETVVSETDSNGAYLLTGIDPGTVSVGIVLGFGYEVTDPAATTGDVVVAAGAAVTGQNIGIHEEEAPIPQDPMSQGSGYWMAGIDGTVYPIGDGAEDLGDVSDLDLNGPIISMAPSPAGNGYWLLGNDGGVFAFGEAEFFGSAAGVQTNESFVGIAGRAQNDGYWIVTEAGTVYAYGDAVKYGTAPATLNASIVNIIGTETGLGYWLVAEDGGVFAYGDAVFHGSTASLTLNAPIIAIASAPGLNGYWLVAEDGGVFAFGEARFYGSTGNLNLNGPIVNIRPLSDGTGYYLFGTDGGVFAFGSATYLGNPDDQTSLIIS